MARLHTMWCRGCDTFRGLVFTVTATLLVTASITLAQQEPLILESQTCYGTGDCSVHTLDCGASHRLAVLQASYGFQTSQVYLQCQAQGADNCTTECCSYNSSTDCKQEFSEDNLQRVQAECSYNQSCQIRSQRGDNLYCSPADRAVTSTYSVLTALCVPDEVTIDPCADQTVSGSLLSLYYSQPSKDNCYCRLDTTTNTTNNDVNGQGNTILISAYDVQASSRRGWSLEVRDSGERVLMNYSGAVMEFPARSERTPVSSLPLTVTFTRSFTTATPQRIWLGFQGRSTSLTLRCGQHAQDYEASFSKSTVKTTTKASTRAPSVRAQVKDEDSTESKNKDTTEIIVYAAVALSSLIVGAFLYVMVRKIRKSWCPPPIRDIECGKNDNSNNDDNNNNNGQTRSRSNTATDENDNKEGATRNGSVPKATANGSALHDLELQRANGRSNSFPRRSSLELYKRPRGSLHSLRRPSFGDLENITESEEEGKFRTHHNHSQLSLHEQEQIFRLVESKLAPLAIDSEEEEEEEEGEKGGGGKEEKRERRGSKGGDDDVFTQGAATQAGGASDSAGKGGKRSGEGKVEEEEEEEEEEGPRSLSSSGWVEAASRLTLTSSTGTSTTSIASYDDSDLNHKCSKF